MMFNINKFSDILSEIISSKSSIFPVGLVLGSGYIHSIIQTILLLFSKDCPEKLTRVCVALFQVLAVVVTFYYSQFLSKCRKGYEDAIKNSFLVKKIDTISSIIHYLFVDLHIILITSGSFFDHVTNLINSKTLIDSENNNITTVSRILSSFTSTVFIVLMVVCFIVYYLKYQTFLSIYQSDSALLFNVYATLDKIPRLFSFFAAIVTIVTGFYNLLTPYEMNIFSKNTIPTTLYNGSIGAGWTMSIMPIIFQPICQSNISYPINKQGDKTISSYWTSLAFYLSLIGKALTYRSKGKEQAYTYLDSITDLNWGLYLGVNFIPRIIEIIFSVQNVTNDEKSGEKELITYVDYCKAILCGTLAKLTNSKNIIKTFLRVDFTYISFIVNMLATIGLLPGKKIILLLYFSLHTFKPLWYRIVYMLYQKGGLNIKDLIVSHIMPIYGGLILTGIIFFL